MQVLYFNAMLYSLCAMRILGVYIPHTMTFFSSPKFSAVGALILLLGLLFDVHPAPGLEITPFATQNQSPVVMIYGLPAIGEPSLVPPGKVDGRFTADFANNFVEISKDKPGGEEIVLDGESTRVTLDIRYGAARRWELGVQIPYITLNGGFLDSFVEGFHNAIGAGGGIRPLEPRNRFLYYYEKDGKTLFNRNDSIEGLGDIRLSGGWQWYEESSGAVALRASLKFPTGERFLGSGGTDLALWVIGRKYFKPKSGQIAVFGGIGLLGMTEGNLLPDQQRSLVWFGNIGAGWSPLSWLALKMQIDGHTPFYKNSDLRPLICNAALLTFGGTVAFSKQTNLDIGVTEDIEYATAPDVVFHFALRHRF
jgi:hypothetical protein